MGRLKKSYKANTDKHGPFQEEAGARMADSMMDRLNTGGFPRVTPSNKSFPATVSQLTFLYQGVFFAREVFLKQSQIDPPKCTL
jgi:hypothetical protein